MTRKNKKSAERKKTFIAHLFMNSNQEQSVRELLHRVDTIQKCGREAVVEIQPDYESRIILSARAR